MTARDRTVRDHPSDHSEPPDGARPATASVLDTARVAARLAVPLIAGGLIVRRPRAQALAEKAQADRSAVELLRRLRARYGPGPLRLRVAGRRVALVLARRDVQRVLDHTPEPFSAATREKVATLGHFQPHGVLVSKGAARPPRRHLNEAALDTERPLHRLAGSMVPTVRREATSIADAALTAGALDAGTFNRGWWRVVRRIVLGGGARDDHELTDLLARLRSDANWAFARPRRTRLRQRFEQRLATHLARAEEGSLAGVIAETAAPVGTDPGGQVPHWLFAFDAAGIVALRALALLSTHPEQRQRALDELAGTDRTSPQQLPYLRACVLESVRLWPTTPVLLRETTTATTWHGASLPSSTTLIIHTPFFHRDPDAVTHADRFAPDAWLDGSARRDTALAPFSAGPARCPGRNLVLFATSTLLAELLERCDFRMVSAPRPEPDRSLPATLNHFGLRFAVRERAQTSR